MFRARWLFEMELSRTLVCLVLIDNLFLVTIMLDGIRINTSETWLEDIFPHVKKHL
jgi:hypothetical protein